MNDLETEMRALITKSVADRYNRERGWEKWLLIAFVLLISGGVTLMLHDMLGEEAQCERRGLNGQDCRYLIENHKLPGEEKFGDRAPQGDDIFELLFGKSSLVTLPSGGTTIVPKK